MKVVGLFVSVVFFVGLARAFAEGFRPGNVFVSDAPFKYCFMQDNYGWDRIWEIDPDTGEAHVFANLMGSECGFITGLAFTPDGCRLRASQNLKNRIVEFAPDGSWTVALDYNDGIFGPEGYNNLAYDAEGSFYVANCIGNILKFPKNGGPGVVFADGDDGITGCGSIAFASDGHLYWADFDILRITPDGQTGHFDDLGPTGYFTSLATDASGHLFAALTGTSRFGLYRFRAGDPSSRERLQLDSPLGVQCALAMAPDQRRLFVVSGHIRLQMVDTLTGSVEVVSGVAGNEGGLGIALVPLALGDFDRNRDIDIRDHETWIGCGTGPNSMVGGGECRRCDTDGDRDVDLGDWAALQRGFGAQAACP